MPSSDTRQKGEDMAIVVTYVEAEALALVCDYTTTRDYWLDLTKMEVSSRVITGTHK